MKSYLTLRSCFERILICAVAGGIVFAFSLITIVSAAAVRSPSLPLPPVLSKQTHLVTQGNSGLMAPTQIQQIIQAARNAWVAGDADAWAALFVPDGEMIVHGRRWVGQTEIRRALADFTAGSAGVKIEIRRTIIDGNQAAVEWDWQDQDKAGRINRAEDIIVIDFAGDRISRWREYIDTETPAVK
jgi:uncharacterized protein (TIGR02246 family)